MTRPTRDVDIAVAFGSNPGIVDKFAIYVPSKDKWDNDLAPGAQEVWIDKFVQLLSNISGGATAMPPTKGAWLNDEGKLIKEQPVVVYSFVDATKFAERIQELVDLTHEMGRVLEQGQVAYEFNQRLFLIDIKVEKNME